MIEQRNVHRVDAISVTLVEEQQKAMVGVQRRGARADAQCAGRRAQDSVMVDLVQVQSPVLFVTVEQVIERVEHGELHVGV
jgi:hypothetical protein